MQDFATIHSITKVCCNFPGRFLFGDLFGELVRLVGATLSGFLSAFSLSQLAEGLKVESAG